MLSPALVHSSNPRMNSLVYRPCNGVIESGEFWEPRQSGHSSTDLFDSMAELNATRSKDYAK